MIPPKALSWPRRILRAAFFLLLTVLTGALLRFALTDDLHAYTRVMLQELYAQAGKIDVLFLGTSHCYRSFDPAAADAALGQNTFNAGSSQQMADGSYHLLREAGAQNNLKTVYLECFYIAYTADSSRSVPLACYLLTDYMRPSLNKYEYLWEMGGLAAFADDLLPARHAMAAPSEMPSLWRGKLTGGYAPGNYAYVTYPGSEEYRGKGFVYTWGTPPYGFITAGSIDAQQPLSAFGRRYLDKITAYCKANGIRLVLVTAPLPSAFAANTPNYQKYVDAMTAYAAQNGLSYWDFTLYRDAAALGLSTADFQDAHHLNGQGAEKFTPVFCQIARRAQAGDDVSAAFYPTLAEKLSRAPDGTYTG